MDHRDYAAANRFWESIDHNRMTLTLRAEMELEDDKGKLFEGEFAFEWVRCPTCEGRGSYVNPSIDSHGITPEEFDEAGDEFVSDYFSGVYDVTCGECEGRRVIPEVKDKKLHQALEDWFADEQAFRAECEQERRMGA